MTDNENMLEGKAASMTMPLPFRSERCDGCGKLFEELYDREFELCEGCWTARKARHDATAPHENCYACGTD